MRRSFGLVLSAVMLLVASVVASGIPSEAAPAKGKPSLKVSVKGLPAGVHAAITVKGPQKYSHKLTATATLKGLTPGTYKVIAKTVSVSGGSEVPSKTRQTVQVSSGRGTVTVRYARQTTPPPPPPPPPTGGPQISTTSVPSGMLTIYYSAQVQRTSGGVPFSTGTWSWTAATAPPGLAIDPDSGFINGTPTAVGGFTFTVTFTGGGFTDSQVLTLVVAPLPAAATWKLISAGTASDCGIKSDDTAWCWGFGDFGSLGDGANTDSAFPVAVAGGGTWRTLAIGGHSCGIKSDGTAWCWGYNSYGQMGDGTTTNALVPVAVSGGGQWKAISVGDDKSCGIQENGSAWCWGVVALGDGTTTQSSVPVQVLGGNVWTSITAGDHTCGTKTDGSGWCWGYNYYGELGVGTGGQEFGEYPEPTQIDSDKDWAQLDGGSNHTCGVAVDMTVSCWGHHVDPLGTSGANSNLSPDVIVEAGPWRSVTTDALHSCAVKTNDSGWCWGDNTYHELGDATAASGSAAPVQVSGTWTALDTGYFKTCGIQLDGKAFCWGQATRGSLGNGSTMSSATPVPVLG